eukprot:scaffold72741_cov54-Phaeocystis_antarctica.AAC.2
MQEVARVMLATRLEVGRLHSVGRPGPARAAGVIRLSPSRLARRRRDAFGRGTLGCASDRHLLVVRHRFCVARRCARSNIHVRAWPSMELAPAVVARVGAAARDLSTRHRVGCPDTPRGAREAEWRGARLDPAVLVRRPSVQVGDDLCPNACHDRELTQLAEG